MMDAEQESRYVEDKITNNIFQEILKIEGDKKLMEDAYFRGRKVFYKKKLSEFYQLLPRLPTSGEISSVASELTWGWGVSELTCEARIIEENREHYVLFRSKPVDISGLKFN
ncbi:hypothetical protein [uncultured Treponema sp.]|uniref:hypothetical protein n=1 Tax=uncultured Treponema sp. TaxID=162155 RepID=UPI0025CC168B|nr:hypothetical protein [uncultured Treponema sp.]